MKIIFCLIIAAVSTCLYADDIEVVVEPREPIVNESFFVTFKIKTSSTEDPYISFTPFGVSVLGKRSQGLSISTVVINGKFTTTKEQAVVYELLAERSGQVYLRNVKVELDGKTIPVKEVKVNVLNEAKKVQDAFIETETSKTKVYLGEGLDVSYYLYFRGSISANDVKEFPKLNKFIKRFHHNNSPIETVQYRGQVLRRILVYSARLYPEKVGLATLDPMKISVQIPETDYSGFGFGSQGYKNKDLSSPKVEIEVLPLPADGVPTSFTGLVGEHEFTLSAPKSRYLVNEPIELKLEVKGKGALENLDAPVIFNDKNLEQFDTKSEVTELGLQAAKKTFEYTLLARGPVKIDSREMELAYFDPNTSRYVVKKISVPALLVDGSAMSPTNSGDKSPSQAVGNQSKPEEIINSVLSNKNPLVTIKPMGIVSPAFSEGERWFDRGLFALNTILSAILAIVAVMWLIEVKNNGGSSDRKNNALLELKKLKRNGMNYSSLYQVLIQLDKTNKMSAGGISLENVVLESQLPSECKDYFIKALAALEGNTFGATQNKSEKAPAFVGKHFKELQKYL